MPSKISKTHSFFFRNGFMSKGQRHPWRHPEQGQIAPEEWISPFPSIFCFSFTLIMYMLFLIYPVMGFILWWGKGLVPWLQQGNTTQVVCALFALRWRLFAFSGGEIVSIPVGAQQGSFRPSDSRALPFPLLQKQWQLINKGGKRAKSHCISGSWTCQAVWVRRDHWEQGRWAAAPAGAAAAAGCAGADVLQRNVSGQSQEGHTFFMQGWDDSDSSGQHLLCCRESFTASTNSGPNSSWKQAGAELPQRPQSGWRNTFLPRCFQGVHWLLGLNSPKTAISLENAVHPRVPQQLQGALVSQYHWISFFLCLLHCISYSAVAIYLSLQAPVSVTGTTAPAVSLSEMHSAVRGPHCNRKARHG